MIDERPVADPWTHDRAASAEDRVAIRELLENWVLWRDAGEWERFATVWHDDAQMNATWFRSGATDFIAGCRKAFAAGMVSQHFLGGSTIDLQRDRAVAQTKMEITQRAQVHGVMVDVVCQGRFFDALERRDGRWGIVLRQPVYELDRMVTVDPKTSLELDPALLASFPEGYRHLAYLQTQLGFDVARNLPGTRGPEIDDLNLRMRRWLGGAAADCLTG